MARAGPSNVARMPSPVVFTSRRRNRRSSPTRAMASCESSSSCQERSPDRAACSVEPTMSVKSTVINTPRSVATPPRTPVRNSFDFVDDDVTVHAEGQMIAARQHDGPRMAEVIGQVVGVADEEQAGVTVKDQCLGVDQRKGGPDVPGERHHKGGPRHRRTRPAPARTRPPLAERRVPDKLGTRSCTSSMAGSDAAPRSSTESRNEVRIAWGDPVGVGLVPLQPRRNSSARRGTRHGRGARLRPVVPPGRPRRQRKGMPTSSRRCRAP